MESQDVRTKRALAIVKKYYPKASATNPGFTVSYLFGNPDNTRRVAQSALIKAAVAKAGINLNVQPQTGWGGKIGTAPFDVAGFAWSKSSDAQFSTNPLFDSNGGNNYSCWNNATVDKLLLPLAERTWSNAVLSQLYTNVEREINKQAWTLPIFRHPLVLGYNAKLQNVSAAPFSPNIIWNYWEWTYKG
jgi:ABC-type transport system substrate-binding protein